MKSLLSVQAYTKNQHPKGLRFTYQKKNIHQKKKKKKTSKK